MTVGKQFEQWHLKKSNLNPQRCQIYSNISLPPIPLRLDLELFKYTEFTLHNSIQQLFFQLNQYLILPPFYYSSAEIIGWTKDDVIRVSFLLNRIKSKETRV